MVQKTKQPEGAALIVSRIRMRTYIHTCSSLIMLINKIMEGT